MGAGAAAEGVQEAELEVPEGHAPGGGGIGRDTEPADAVLVRELVDDLEDSGENVEVLVAVRVDDAEAGPLKALDLGAELALDLIPMDFSEERAADEGGEAGEED